MLVHAVEVIRTVDDEVSRGERTLELAAVSDLTEATSSSSISHLGDLGDESDAVRCARARRLALAQIRVRLLPEAVATDLVAGTLRERRCARATNFAQAPAG